VTVPSFGPDERHFLGMLHVPPAEAETVLRLVMKLGCPNDVHPPR
jgi:hypothetical protein